MSPNRNAISEELWRAVRALLAKGVKPDAVVAERAGCSVDLVRKVRTHDRKAADTAAKEKP